MKLLYRIGILLAGLVLLTACSSDNVKGNGKIATKSRTVAAFDQIKVSGAYKLIITVGGRQSVSITGDSNVIPLVITTVKDDRLMIKNKPGVTFNVSKPMLVRISTPKLKRVMAAGANQINASRISTDEFSLKTSGSVQANLSGTARKVEVSISGSGNVNADRLVARDVNVRLTGSGHILVNASKNLNTKIIGSGSIIYSGNPSSVNQTITGSGKIERLR